VDAVKRGWSPADRPQRDRKLYDPYYDWARSTDFAYYGKPKWVPVLIEIDKGNSKTFAAAAKRESWGAGMRIPRIYREPPSRLQKELKFVTAMVERARLPALLDAGQTNIDAKRIEIGRMVDVPPDPHLTEAGWGDLTLELPEPLFPKGTVLIGVIDDSIAFAHERFRTGTSTRIHYFWDQQVPSDDSGRWDYGREIRKTEVPDGIDDLLRRCEHGNLIDEDEVYRLAGHLDFADPVHKPLAMRGSHGTHVADLACNPPIGPGPIVAVQLPIATTEDTSGATLKPQAFDALLYLLDCADRLGGSEILPLVVNLSYGMYAGPHDGSGPLEQAIDHLLDSCNTDPNNPVLQVVLPAGNSHLLRCHAAFALKPKPSKKVKEEKDPSRKLLHWRVLPDDRTESFLEIWYPEKHAADLEVSVTAPNGLATPFFGLTTSYVWSDGTRVLGRIDFYPPPAGSKRGVIRIALAPTAGWGGSLTGVPSGVWQVRVQNRSKKKIGDIDAWIQRDDTVHGYRRGARQSYFDDPLYARFDQGGRPIEWDLHPDTKKSYVKREGTFNAISSGSNSIVASGLIRQSWKPAGYSASGPLYGQGRGGSNPHGPEIMAGSDDSASHNGILAAGSRSGSCVAMRGTSVAAPQVARLIAADIAGSGKGDRDAATDLRLATPPDPHYTESKKPPGAAQIPDPERGGSGRVDYQTDRKPRFER
jgi:hypothetical protein